jgi:hypothetical protein
MLKLASLLVAAPLLATAATASAGVEIVVGPSFAPPPPVFVVAAAPQAFVNVMARRWSVELGVGSMALTPSGNSAASQQFGIGELAIRFRATPRLELELAIDAGSLSSNDTGDAQVTSTTLGVRYHMRPGRLWDWYVLAGIGGTEVTAADATQADQDAAMRTHIAAGIGLERRFGNFGINAELRVMALSATDADKSASTNLPPATAAAIAEPMSSSSTSDAETGAQLTVGASYYF